MTRPTPTNTQAVSDDTLRAYLDGTATDDQRSMIDDALAQDDAQGDALTARLMALDTPGPAVRAAYDLQALAAPEMPAGQSDKPHPGGPHRMWGYAALPAALAASFAVGMFVSPLRQAPAPAGWIDQVASYQALYVTETLSGAVQDSALTRIALDRARTTLGLSFDDAPQIDGLTFKRAQMLAVDGEALIQIAYLDADGTPWALCITRVDQDDRTVASKMSHALAASSWVSGGLGYVLVGGQDTGRAARLADDLRATL